MTRLAQEAAPWRPEEETDVRHTKSSSRTHEAVVRIERTPSRERDMPSWPALAASPAREPSRFTTQVRRLGQIRVWRMLKKYLTFVGPGVLVSVAYIDPGNYSTDVAAGADHGYKLLFIVFVANLLAVILQSLSCRLGTVTGHDLAWNCREHFPKWLNIILYIFAEAAIVCTDIAEVIGCAIALNILLHIPLPAGVVLTMVDVLLVLMAYRPEGSLRGIRLFEFGVSLLVLAVVVCFSTMLAKLSVPATDVLRGYLPNKVAFTSGVYESVGIVGATVMPHSLFLGSGIVQARLRAWDVQHQYYSEDKGSVYEHAEYRPSAQAIRSHLAYSIVEIITSLFTFALYTNSAILIIAGAALRDTPNAANADLFATERLLADKLAPSAGKLFACALLFSGMSSSFVATMAGQMVSEGFLRWSIRPWLRRLVTRSIAIVPCVIVAASVGRDGLGQVLNASQVALCILLPVLVAPLVYLTGRRGIMRAPVRRHLHDSTAAPEAADGQSMSMDSHGEVVRYVHMENHFIVKVLAILVWLLLTVLNVIMIVWLGLGKG